MVVRVVYFVMHGAVRDRLREGAEAHGESAARRRERQGRHEGDRPESEAATDTVQHTGNVAMRPGGFEPPTNSLEGCCSIHLSYGRAIAQQQLTGRGRAASPNSATNSAKLNAPLPRCAGRRAAP